MFLSSDICGVTVSPVAADPKVSLAGRVEPDIYDAVMRLAAEEERTQSQMVRILVREALKARAAPPAPAPDSHSGGAPPSRSRPAPVGVRRWGPRPAGAGPLSLLLARAGDRVRVLPETGDSVAVAQDRPQPPVGIAIDLSHALRTGRVAAPPEGAEYRGHRADGLAWVLLYRLPGGQLQEVSIPRWRSDEMTARQRRAAFRLVTTS